jgi:hypothetical protein
MAAVALLPLAACAKVGVGSGTVVGRVDVPACTFDLKNEGAPMPYRYGNPFDFKPTFFVGEPIDADPNNGPRFPANQLVIRVQPEALRKEDADALVIWVFDSAAVARCVRGAMPGGVPEWDPVVCDRSQSMPTEPGRMLVGMTSEKVSAFFALNHSCPQGFVSANALGSCTDGSCPDVSLCPGRGSWVTFSEFGSVPSKSDPSQPISPRFRVNDTETIAVSAFHLELCDGATVLAKLDGVLPIPQPNITATLEGDFQFVLVRGD